MQDVDGVGRVVVKMLVELREGSGLDGYVSTDLSSL